MPDNPERHLLLTAWAFPPARTSGVYRAAGIANAFSSAGWRVTVLCGPAELFRSNGVIDESLMGTVCSSIETLEVPLEHHELSTDITQWSWLRARQPELWRKRRLRRDHRAFPEAWFGSWAPALRRAAAQVHAQHAVTLSLGTAAPYVDFAAGEYLHARHGIPYILDYRDAWTFWTFSGKPPAGLSDEVRARETSLVRDAFQVWFVNDAIRGWHAAQYPDQASVMRTIRNGFDLPAGVDDPAALGVEKGLPGSQGVTFGYIGTINFGAFPLDEVVEGWRLARDRLPQGSSLILRGHLGRTGVGSPQLLAALADAERIGIRFEGPVARDRVWEVYREFDALLLALPSGPGVTSGKVYEYAATGLPVVSVHTPETPVGEVLAPGGSWHPAASMQAEDVADAFVAAAEQAMTGSEEARVAAIAAAARWERSRIMELAVTDVERSLSVGGKTRD